MTPFPIRDSVAVITGAGSGIGAALALALAEQGAKLALVDIDADGLARTQSQLPENAVASVHQIDVADKSAIADLSNTVKETHGAPAAVLVNNAGVALGGDFADVSETNFDWLLEINLMAPIRLTRQFLPDMRALPAAQIVNISSIFGVIAPAGQSAYATSKFGLRGFSEALRHELAGSSVGVTVVHPGGVATAIARNARNSAVVSPEEAERKLKEIDAKLTLPPETAAQLIVRAIETRAPRLLIGKDAKLLEFIQRLKPVGYWNTVRKQFGA